MNTKYQIEPGSVFSRLMTITNVFSDGKNPRVWVICECGQMTLTHANRLIKGGTRSCGCLRREMTIARFTKHGKSSSKEHTCWIHIRARCEKPNNQDYYLYGARGIKVCERWKDFNNFYNDMGPAPSSQHSIDRIDSNKDYCPENCRWATPKEQSNNREYVIRVEYKGQTRTLLEWEEETGIKAQTIRARIKNYGWPIGKALGYE